MKHDYNSYAIPAPVIKDVSGCISDAIGDLTTTHTLVASLVGDVEQTQDLARQQQERPNTVSPIALEQRLGALWCLAEAIDARLKDSIILLRAVEEREP
ncbi:hypothetical protein [Pelagerythrobacter aerophilus]